MNDVDKLISELKIDEPQAQTTNKQELQTNRDNNDQLMEKDIAMDQDLNNQAEDLEFKIKSCCSFGLMTLTSIAAFYIFVLLLINRGSKDIIYEKMHEHNLQLIDLSQMITHQGSYEYKLKRCNSDLQAHSIQGISELLTEADVYNFRTWSNYTALTLTLEYATNNSSDWNCTEVEQKVRTLPKSFIIAKSSVVDTSNPNGLSKIFGGYADVQFDNKNQYYIPGSGKSFAFSLTDNEIYRCVDPTRELRGSNYLIAGLGDAFEISCRNNGDFELNTSQLKPPGNNGAYAYTYGTNPTYAQTAFKIAGSWVYNVTRVEVFSIQN